jgi:hypothetical protein
MYDVKKRGMIVPFKGERDVCEELAKGSKEPETSQKLKQYHISPSCPIKAVRISPHLLSLKSFSSIRNIGYL